MAAINFPDNPYTGQVFTSGNSTWTWDGFKWVSGLSPAAYLPLTGGTMKGSLILFEDPVAAMEASTKEYTDLHLSLSGGTLSGPLILAADPTAALGASTKEYVDNKASTTAPVMDGTAAVGVSALFARSDHVHPTDTSRAAQSSLANYLPLAGGTVSGATNFSSTLTVGTTLYPSYSATPDFLLTGSATARTLQWAASGYSIAWYSGTQILYFFAAGTGVATLDAAGSLVLYSTGNLTIAGNAWKPGGGAWAASSDIRVKQDVADYASGLDQVCALRPVSYRYNGEGGTKDDGKTYYGLTAQEAREIMPELVFAMPGDNAIEGLLGVDATALTFALVNAVKTLAARVAELEAKAP